VDTVSANSKGQCGAVLWMAKEFPQAAIASSAESNNPYPSGVLQTVFAHERWQ
jgi:hypothetical protein